MLCDVCLSVRSLLDKEMEVVKKGMQHGDLSLDAYTQVRFFLALNVEELGP
jgi:hypothetical protein